MPVTPAYDWAPLFQLLALALVLALGPLSWVWLRHGKRQERHYRLCLLTLFLTFDLVLFGAFTRLSDSGLGCPDWPGCYGHASPIGAATAISAAQQHLPDGPVTGAKAWIEMLHRYLATAVGVLILTLALFEHTAPRAERSWWPWLTLVWVCVQGAFGALTVSMKLFPAIVTLHLLGAMVLLVLLSRQAWRLSGAARHAPISAALRAGIGLTFGLLWLQTALGAWVSTNYAVLACRDFPQCQGTWWPPMDWAQGFEIWRPLGRTAQGLYIGFPALTAIHFAHRLMAGLVLAALLLLAWRLYRVAPLRRSAQWLAALALWQLGTGLGNVLLNWPLAAALAHTGGAAALLVTLTGLWRVSAGLLSENRAR